MLFARRGGGKGLKKAFEDTLRTRQLLLLRFSSSASFSSSKSRSSDDDAANTKDSTFRYQKLFDYETKRKTPWKKLTSEYVSVVELSEESWWTEAKVPENRTGSVACTLGSGDD